MPVQISHLPHGIVEMSERKQQKYIRKPNVSDALHNTLQDWKVLSFDTVTKQRKKFMSL